MLSKLSRLFLVFTFFSLIFLVKASSAAAATLLLSPASGSVQNGSTISVDVKINSTQGVTSGLVAITYPSDKLEAVAPNSNLPDKLIDTANSPFFITGQAPGAPIGAIGIIFAAEDPAHAVTGTINLATIKFKAKVGSGTAAIGFNSYTTAGGANENALLDSTGAAITITATTNGSYTLTGTPPPPPPPPPPGTPPPPATNPPAATSHPATTPPPSATPPTSSGADTTAPKISGIQVTDIGTNTAKITWTTDEASSSIVEYNQTDAYLISHDLILSAKVMDLTTSHSVTLPTDILRPGFGYTFRVRSIDAAGNSSQSDNSDFRTKGYTVKLKIVDKTTGEPLSNVTVTFTAEKIVKTTDNDGVVLYDNIAQLDQPLKVSFGDKVYLDTIVKVTGESGIGSANSQEVVLKVAGIAEQKQTFRNIGWAMILVGVVALIGVGVVWIKNRRKVSPI